jgi:hypothetical protein
MLDGIALEKEMEIKASEFDAENKGKKRGFSVMFVFIIFPKN